MGGGVADAEASGEAVWSAPADAADPAAEEGGSDPGDEPGPEHPARIAGTIPARNAVTRAVRTIKGSSFTRTGR
jgi:hypothetical protein